MLAVGVFVGGVGAGTFVLLVTSAFAHKTKGTLAQESTVEPVIRLAGVNVFHFLSALLQVAFFRLTL